MSITLKGCNARTSEQLLDNVREGGGRGDGVHCEETRLINIFDRRSPKYQDIDPRRLWIHLVP
jgi:hypothetical protein